METIMRKPVTFFVLLVVSLVVLVTCSSKPNQETLEKDQSANGDHHTSSYLEIANMLEERDVDELAYSEHTVVMEMAIQAYERKDYDFAQKLLSEMLQREKGPEILHEDAKQLKVIVDAEAVWTNSNKDITKQNDKTQKEELLALQDERETDEILTIFQLENSELMEEVELGLEEESIVEREGTKQDVEKEPLPEEEQVTYVVYNNERFGFSIEYPEGMQMDRPPTNGDDARFYNEDLEIVAYGGHNMMGETIESYFNADMDSVENEIAYQRLTEDWYVISYKENGMIVYKRFYYGEDVFNTFEIRYPESKQEKYEPIVTYISETFVSSAY
jgi:hypothetical protein